MHLFLILMITFTAATRQHGSVFTVRVGDKVTLPCRNMTDGQNNCNRTTWRFNGLMSEMLFEAGQIQLNTTNKADRLSMTANCSLVIKNVLVKDVGQYTCRQLISEKQRLNSLIYLSFVHMTRQKVNDSVVLNCSVVDYNHYRNTVEWLYEGKGENCSHADPSLPYYRSTALLTIRLHQTLFSSTKCKVTNLLTKEVQLFTFTDRSLKNTGWHWWYIAVSVASTGIIIIVLLFIKRKTIKGSKKEEGMTESSLQPEVTVLGPESSEDKDGLEEDVFYATVCYAKNKKVKAKVQYSATNSTVNISSPKATTDQGAIYSTVKQKKTDVTQ